MFANQVCFLDEDLPEPVQEEMRALLGDHQGTVVASLEEAGFLVSLNGKVWKGHALAPAAVRDSVKMEKSLPESGAGQCVRNRFLEGMRLSVPESLSPLHKASIIAMNGVICVSPSVGVATDATHLICDSVLSPTYQAACARGIPIVMSSFIDACEAAATATGPIAIMLNLDLFSLRPLTGCLITVTGLAQATRKKLETIIVAQGGEYIPDLKRSSTHLIAETASGVKHRYALAWGIPVVRMSWIFECVNQRKCVPTQQFALDADKDNDQAFWLGEAPKKANALSNTSIRSRKRRSESSSSVSGPTPALVVKQSATIRPPTLRKLSRRSLSSPPPLLAENATSVAPALTPEVKEKAEAVLDQIASITDRIMSSNDCFEMLSTAVQSSNEAVVTLCVDYIVMHIDDLEERVAQLDPEMQRRIYGQ